MQAGCPFRVAIVGVGHWHARRYIASVVRLEQRIVAVWDDNPSVASRVALETGASTNCDLRDLLAATRPDVIVGLGVHSQMPSLLALMLETPAALILEKPLGISVADVSPLVERVEHQGRFAAVAFINRYTPIWSKVIALASANRLGRRCYAHFRIINGSPARYQRDGSDWVLDPVQSGGGSLINLGTHTLDAFLQFCGESVSVTSAQLGYRTHDLAVEDYSLATLRSVGGTIGCVESGYCFAAMSGGEQEWRLVTSNAYLVQRPDGLVVHTLDDGQTERLPGMSSADAYHTFVSDSLARLRLGLPPIATLRDGLQVLELVNAIYRAAERNDVQQ